jgi:hypothetical protein
MGSALALGILVTGHLVGDFVLQPKAWAEGKDRLGVLGLHVLVVTVVTWVLLGDWTEWRIPLAIFASHGVIDLVKSRWGGAGLAPFLVDQAAHAVSLVAIALLLPVDPDRLAGWQLGGPVFLQGLVLVSGLVLATRASGVIVLKSVQRFLDQMDTPAASGDARRGFPDGGWTIGNLERALIFTLILTRQEVGVGFLVAAKSILRFGEIRDPENRKEAEYIIIGTMLSFLLGIVFSLGCRQLLERLHG